MEEKRKSSRRGNASETRDMPTARIYKQTFCTISSTPVVKSSEYINQSINRRSEASTYVSSRAGQSRVPTSTKTNENMKKHVCFEEKYSKYLFPCHPSLSKSHIFRIPETKPPGKRIPCIWDDDT